MLDWLEASFYNGANNKLKRQLRQSGLVPSKPDADMPEPYRIWKSCQRNNALWWSGGISNQPYVMMHEFAVCEIASNIFEKQVENYREIIDANSRRREAPKSSG